MIPHCANTIQTTNKLRTLYLNVLLQDAQFTQETKEIGIVYLEEILLQNTGDFYIRLYSDLVLKSFKLKSYF